MVVELTHQYSYTILVIHLHYRTTNRHLFNILQIHYRFITVTHVNRREYSDNIVLIVTISVRMSKYVQHLTHLSCINTSFIGWSVVIIVFIVEIVYLLVNILVNAPYLSYLHVNIPYQRYYSSYLQ